MLNIILFVLGFSLITIGKSVTVAKNTASYLGIVWAKKILIIAGFCCVVGAIFRILTAFGF